MVSDRSSPLKLPRLITLFLSFSWGIIGLAAAINALVKSKKEKAEIIENLPERTTLEINTNDASTAGTVIAVVCVLISVLSLIYMVLLLLPGIPSSNSAPRRLSTKTLPIQWISLAFLSLWLFTVQIPFTYFFRTRSVGVRAFIGRIELSEQLVKTLQKALGISTRYKDKNYLELLAILPWLTLVFTVLAAGVAFMAHRRDETGSEGSEKDLPRAPSN